MHHTKLPKNKKIEIFLYRNLYFTKINIILIYRCYFKYIHDITNRNIHTFTFAFLKNIPSENNPNKIPPTSPFKVRVACKIPLPSTKKINPNEKIP